MSQLDDTTVPEQMTDVEIEQSNSDASDFRMKTPPPDWGYNLLLKKIADKMTTEDINRAKSLFKGELKKQLSEKIKTATSLIDTLEERGFLDRNNLLYLQAVLLHANRYDLFDKVAELAVETLKDPVYFHKPSDEPAPGYAYVKFHIKGQNFGNLYTRSSLEDLRSKAAKIMGVLPQHILISGVELCGSVMVTMMIATEHVAFLESALMKEDCKNDLASIGVDEVWIDDKIRDMEGFAAIQSEEKAQQQQQHKRKLQEELQKYQTFLQMPAIEVIELKKKTSQLMQLLSSIPEKWNYEIPMYCVPCLQPWSETFCINNCLRPQGKY